MNSRADKPPYLWALVTGVVVFAIYLATLAPTTAFWDTSEYIAAAKVLGIPHPPGNPLFIVLAHTFGLLPLAESYAVRINLFGAVASAAAAGLWFLVAERWLRGIVPHRWARYGAAFAGVLVGATSWSVWNQSAVNEKVYTLSLLSIALVMWLVVRWGDDEPGTHRDRWLVLIAYVLALTSTNHLMGVLALPALAVYVLWTDWRTVLRPWAIVTFWALLLAVSGEWIAMLHGGTLQAVLVATTLAIFGYALWKSPRDPLVYLGLAAVVVGISLNYVWLPMRAAQYPPINEGEPVGFLSQALQDVLNRVQYGKPPLSQRQATFTAQLANFWQYFSWQYAREWGRIGAAIALLFTVLGLSGLWALWKSDRRAGIAGVALLGTLSVGLVFYMNFKYGFSLYPEETSLSREVRERDYFFVGSFAVFGAFIALGFGALMRAVAEFFRHRGTVARRWAAASPVLALALIPLFGNRETASRAGETIARDFAYDILESVEPYGILITAGDNDTFPLWYAQEVEGIRRDVTLANLSLMNTRWHLRQLRRRRTPPLDPARAAALWRPQPDEAGVPLTDSVQDTAASPGRWIRPTEPVFSLSVAGLDSLPEAMQVPANGGVAFDSLQIRFGQEVLMLQDLATIFLIRDNMGKRPIFFSWSDGGYPDQTLGLSPYLVSQGLVRKLMPRPVVANDSIVLSPSLGFLDLPRTEKLLWDVYHWKAAARERPRGWVDQPSGSILQLYAVVYSGAARAFAAAGQRELAARADSVAREVSESLNPKNPL
ncbi:MAG: glycosyltransferase family 117 protein [Gemmatimonadales bacterium]